MTTPPTPAHAAAASPAAAHPAAGPAGPTDPTAAGADLAGAADLVALATELLALGSATVYEAARADCALPHTLRPAWPGAAVAGPALPVRTAPGDNLPLHLALEAALPGEVLVVDARGAACGYWGEILTVAARYRGITGLVIDGGVRDVDRLAELDFPTFSTSITVRGTVKKDPGTIGHPVTIGGVPVARGDLVIADVDGVVIVPRHRVPDVLAASRARAEAEQTYLARIRAGELTTDIYDLRPTATSTG